MPREHRKRGKKQKKKPEEEHDVLLTDAAPEYALETVEEPQPGPSWIKSKPHPDVDREAPFGYVDADVKAYFRTVDMQIREWQETRGDDGVEHTASSELDPNEDKRTFFVAALQEMTGKEKQLATDPDCSAILERMVYSMDDFVRRVFMDTLSGSYEQLAKHRFASHVCQTVFSVIGDTVSREMMNIFPPLPETGEDSGELRTAIRLVLDACEELLPCFTSLIMDPFASHVLRALLLLLVPDIAPADSTLKSAGLRSKKSAAWKARQGQFSSVFVDETSANGEKGKGKESEPASTRVPLEFSRLASAFVARIREELTPNEVRALAADKVASPVLQLLLELEAHHGISDEPDSLMDRVLVGIVTQSHTQDVSGTAEPSDYLMTLLRDPTSSHLLETLVSRSPEAVFDLLWQTYFRGKLAGAKGRKALSVNGLALHPVANFVVARAVERLGAEGLREACEELGGEGVRRVLQANRIGVIKALIDRAGALHAAEDSVMKALQPAFGIESEEDKKQCVPCVLRLLSLQDYRGTVASSNHEGDDAGGHEPRGSRPPRTRGNKSSLDPLEPKVQGALLLQSLLRLSSTHNQIVTDSILNTTQDELLAMSRHPVSSRVLDAVMESPSVLPKTKRSLILAFAARFHDLVDDRIGSRVGDRLWAAADPYLKVKIGNALIPHEQFLASSYYGKFFAKNLNLYLLKRNAEEWKDWQLCKIKMRQGSGVPTSGRDLESKEDGRAQQASAVKPEKRERKKRKREADVGDVIDAVFENVLGGKKFKRGQLEGQSPTRITQTAHRGTESKNAGSTGSGGNPGDRDLSAVLGAIRSAPKEQTRAKPKRAKG
ncbi:ARM repeat-containing protein [Punctularia strigosozonata HHB-11173 SS5]|uniref:ARM repeat-containing protein n=1 Tax=Punctularia strigosozonata (strain HHB-11173) TaxID=741275 RepID=UPI00044183B0|nr:ARM repeat-containing protein [Punctularia strigosozonata HHB-11173 SS5]EIN10789.1 ARM repeat-containing protein [Punctularia strigosozonata HHB-11173 SS5]